MTLVWLTLVSCLLVVALLAVVALNLVRIARSLEAIGGDPASYLAKIRFGLRAIEQQTGMLAPQVAALNQGLRALDAGLRSVDGDLARTLEALREGGGRR